jgi:MFS family permease
MTAAVARPGLGLLIIGLGASMGPLDIAVNVALPAITAHFRLPLADVQWLVICYVLTYGSLMLVCGKLGDLFGHRLIFRIGMVLSMLGCSLCAAAPNWDLFLAARVAQGVGTALALSCTPALATSLFPAGERTRALAGFASAMAIATAAGPILGGIVVELWGWPAVYWMRVPIAFAALALSGLLPPPKPDPRPFDSWGAILLALSMCAFLVGVISSQQKAVPAGLPLAVVAGAAGLLWLYVRHSRHVAEPIIRPTLFADAAFSVPNVINVLANLATFSLLLLTPYYLIGVLKLSALTGGLVLSLVFVGSLAGAPLAARLVPLIGQRPAMFAGVAGVGLGLLPLAFTAEATPLVLVAALLLIEGIGNGLLTVAYTDLVTGTLAERDRGVAGALSLLTRTLGVVVGASVLTALHARGAGGGLGTEAFLDGYRFAFLAAGGGLLAALSLSCLIPRVWFVR